MLDNRHSLRDESDKGRSERLTKARIHSGDRRGTGVVPAVDVVASLERSLRNLNTDYIDVLQTTRRVHAARRGACRARSRAVGDCSDPTHREGQGQTAPPWHHVLGSCSDVPRSMHRRRILTRNRSQAAPIALSASDTSTRWRGVRGPMAHRLPVCTWST